MAVATGNRAHLDIEYWIDKQRDVLHLNYDENGQENDVFDTLLRLARTVARDASLTAYFCFQLTTKKICMDTPRCQRLLVCLDTVTIYAPLQPALESGLFGLLGDARVVLIDADDMERTKQYRSFWEKHGLPSQVDPHAAHFFDKYCEPGIDASPPGDIGMLKFAWLVHMWDINKVRVADPDEAWMKPPDYKQGEVPCVWQWPRWVPNRDHPWMREMLEAMPDFHPTVMVRLCT